MLVLSRKPGERIKIGEDIWVECVRVGPDSVRIGVTAPREVAIVREEILPAEPPAIEVERAPIAIAS